MNTLPIYYVNAFTSTPFSGNPAAVILLDKWLPDDTLLKLANEIGLPETAFLVANHIHVDLHTSRSSPMWTCDFSHGFCIKNDLTKHLRQA